LGTDLEIAAIRRAVDGVAGLPHHVGLAVNASPMTLADPRPREIIAAHPERTLVIEITEHSVVEDYPLLTEHLTDLRALGVLLAVDDTGAGFSSLRHIVQLAPDVIKIDISLAQGVGSSPLKRALAASLTEFAHAAGARMVVEGIEAVEDLVAWSALGAEAVQGYLTGRPGPLPPPEECAAVTALRTRLHA
jgi:EAL domain-containing protein (putative c-di-GMP-specific phosphodiesterase class I)